MANKASHSPYAKYNKGPFQYSDEYHRWADAVAKNNTEEAEVADAAFRKRFGVPAVKREFV